MSPPVHPPMPSDAISPRLPNTVKFSLPFSEEVSLSPRGQRLPLVIQNKSFNNLQDLQKSPGRRRSGYDDGDSENYLDLGRTTSAPLRRTSLHRMHSDYGLDVPLTPNPPANFPLKGAFAREPDERRSSVTASLLLTPQMRSQRLIGNSNPRYRWERYYRTEEELKKLRKPLRRYYERNNYLIQQYIYIDRLLDSSLPHNLIQEYGQEDEINIPETIAEEAETGTSSPGDETDKRPSQPRVASSPNILGKVKRTPRDIYRVPEEDTPLLGRNAMDGDGDGDGEGDEESGPKMPDYVPEEETDSGSKIVAFAIYLNMAANTVLLALKIVVTIMTSSLSVLASLVDAALDFLSTFIVWLTTTLISREGQDRQKYPVGRARLEPIGVLVFSVIMITSFFQVALESANRLMSGSHEVVQLSVAAVAIMASTVVIKFLCWLWCRLIRNSSVQALAQDAMTDVVFNIFSIIFPLLGYFLHVWWLDPLGGLLLSLYVIISWSLTTRTHILNLTGHAAGADERNILLYLTMRFAHTIHYIQALAAYHAGDKINVEVDIVLDEKMSLKDSHDLSESLQYVLESVPGVERAFVHADYRSQNLPSHMRQ